MLLQWGQKGCTAKGHQQHWPHILLAFPTLPASLRRQHVNPAAQCTFVGHLCAVPQVSTTQALLRATQARTVRHSACYTAQGNCPAWEPLVTSWKRLEMAWNKGKSVFLELHSLHHSSATGVFGFPGNTDMALWCLHAQHGVSHLSK